MFCNTVKSSKKNRMPLKTSLSTMHEGTQLVDQVHSKCVIFGQNKKNDRSSNWGHF